MNNSANCLGFTYNSHHQSLILRIRHAKGVLIQAVDLAYRLCFETGDNDVNAIRPVAIGRKGGLFLASVNGAKASANLYGFMKQRKRMA